MVSSSIALARRSNPWVALALIVAAQFMVVLDISIVNVALATIKSDLHFSEASLQWVISAYAIVFGGFLLLGGRIADLSRPPPRLRHGHRALHPRVGAQRPRVVGSVARRVPRPAGPRRRTLRARRPVSPDDDVPRRPRTQPRARHLGCRVGQRRGRRCPARRCADVVPRLALGLLHQRSGRPRAHRARPAPDRREPRPERDAATSMSPARPPSPPR